MTSSVTVYGFGSAFGDTDAAIDVDLLIIHSNKGCESCRLATHCKQILSDHIGRAHITMLSVAEEAHFKFIETARAILLGHLRESYLQKDVETLVSQIENRVTDIGSR